MTLPFSGDTAAYSPLESMYSPSRLSPVMPTTSPSVGPLNIVVEPTFGLS